MSDFKRITENGLVFYQSEMLNKCDFFRHIFTTRYGGVSVGENYSLNLGINKEKKANVLENFNRVCAQLDAKPEEAFVLKQIHTDNVHRLEKGDKSGIGNTEERIQADAIISNEKGSFFGVFCADCVPVIIACTSKKVAATIHSGWRSTALHIARKATKKIIDEYGCKPDEIKVAIGPSIHECCFEVDFDVAEKFEEKYRNKKGEKYFINLQKVITEDLISLGIKKENISESGLCTACNPSEFFSSRAQNGKHGLMMAAVKILEK